MVWVIRACIELSCGCTGRATWCSTWLPSADQASRLKKVEGLLGFEPGTYALAFSVLSFCRFPFELLLTGFNLLGLIGTKDLAGCRIYQRSQTSERTNEVQELGLGG